MICYNLNHVKLFDRILHRSLIHNGYVCNQLQHSSFLDLRVLRASMDTFFLLNELILWYSLSLVGLDQISVSTVYHWLDWIRSLSLQFITGWIGSDLSLYRLWSPLVPSLVI